MKHIQKISTLIFFLALVFLIQACQEEVVDIVNPPAEEVITASSDISDLVLRTTSNDGSYDNIIDRNSCVSVVFPVTVTINDTEIVIDSEDDLDDLEDLLDDLDDFDLLDIVFPITVISADYNEIVINNEDELEDLDDCDDDEIDDDIECLDFVYPLTVQVYDSDNQLASVITINNDRELYELLEDLDDEDDEYLTFAFPISVILWNGNEIEVNSHSDLVDLIEESDDMCDEDDDNDFDDDDVDDSDFVDVLTSGSWEVSDLRDDGDNYTALFQGYILTFATNGTFTLSNAENTLNGEWESSGNSGEIEEMNMTGK